MNFSNRLNNLGLGVFQKYDSLKRSYQLESKLNNNPSLLDLSLGSSDLLPPQQVLDAISRSIYAPNSSSYCLHEATRPFREAVAAWAANRFEVNINPDKEVLFLVGSQEGTAHLPMTILNPGNIGLIADPSYPSHRGGLILADAQIQEIVLKHELKWKPSFSSLKTSQWDQIKLMILGFPHNPTAQVGEQSWLDEAMTYGLRHNVVIAHDNPYVDLCLDGEAPSLLRSHSWRQFGIEFFSLSKAWCMGGFRLGFAIGAENIIKSLGTLKSVVDFNQSLALQAGAIEALTELSHWPENLLEIYRDRRDITIKSLSEIGWDVPTPSMAMYLWMPIPPFARKNSWDDETFSHNLLANTGIALTPGSGFGEGGKGWLRLALVRPSNELEIAIARIGSWFDANN